MELKHHLRPFCCPRPAGLNRTFYGIETYVGTIYDMNGKGLNRTFYGIETNPPPTQVFSCSGVLIVPFMELKLSTLWINDCSCSS